MKQKNSLIDRIPNNPSALLFLMLAVVGSALLFISPIRILALLLGTLVSFVLTSISPALPYDYHQIEFYRGRWSIFWITFVMTLFFCLIANASFSLYADTLFGDDPSRLYFLKDWHNVIQYTFVVPVYVGLEVCLISIALYSWPQLRRLANEASSSGRPKVKVPRSIRLYRSRTLNKAALWFSYNANRLRFSGFIFLSLSITGILISTFINDALNPERVATTYWFVRQLDEKHRVLNEAGGYYMLMNAAVLFMICIATLSYLSVSIEVVRFATNIDQSTFAKNVQINKNLSAEKYQAAIEASDRELAETLREFEWCYTLAKIILVFCVFNIILWKISPIGSVANVDVGIIALSVIGIFVIPFPRLFLEYRWHKFKFDWKGPTGQKYKDMRSHNQIIWSKASNFVFFGLIFSMLEERYGTLRYWFGGFWPFLKSFSQTLGA
jgi:hypothetical protein